MESFDDYEYKLGQLISLFQLIEHDLKTILRLLSTSITEDEIKKMTLGKTIIAISDNSDNLFSSSDYVLLKALTEKRNYYCHRCVLDFAYEEDFQNNPKFKIAYDQLSEDLKIIKKLQFQTESIRISLIKSAD